MITSEAQQYLDSFINHEMHLKNTKPSSFKLERARQLLDALGNPQNNLRIIHVAGSKGKGSTCALTANIIRNAGYKVGLYTSPHLNNYRERIRVLSSVIASERHACRQAGSERSNLKIASSVASLLPRNDTITRPVTGDIFPDCISEEELCLVLEAIKPTIEELRSQREFGVLTFFEVYTALAFYFFDQQGVDCVVLETGLGGRLDATNVVNSLLAVITPISLEHTRFLGDTITDIAKEKAAIIKDQRQKAVIAPQSKEAIDVLKKRCAQCDIEPVWVKNDVTFSDITSTIHQQTFDMTTPKAFYEGITLPLLGKHQRDNAAVSICVVEALQDLGFKISVDAVRAGLSEVFWPGRFEIIEEHPTIVLDSAHNPESARVLSETMKDIFGRQKIVLVLGLSKDKNQDAICKEFEKLTEHIIFTKAQHPRASHLPGAVDVKQALDLAHAEAGHEGVILVAGSIFVVSEARRYLSQKEQACIR